MISTGAPQGVILGIAEKRWLRPSNVVEVEIGELGWLTTMFKVPTTWMPVVHAILSLDTAPCAASEAESQG